MIGPLLVVAGLVVGILTGDRLGPGAGGAALTIAAGGVLVAARGPGRAVRLAAVVAVAVGTGAAVEQRALDGQTRSPLQAPTLRGESGVAVLTLAEDPDGPFYRVEALARVSQFAGRDAGDRTVLLQASQTAASELRALELGDRLRIRGRLGPLAGYSERLRWRHAVGTLTVDDVQAVAAPAAPWIRVANAARRRVLAGTVALPGDARALLAGFLLGDTRAVPDALVEDFRSAGLSHVLAVSGANVAFVLVLFLPLLSRGARHFRLGGGLGILVVFATMTRFEPSVLRASVMAGLVMIARAVGRPAHAPRVLALAAAVLLVADPFLVRSIGFLLSCGACAGIVAVGPRITARLVGPTWLRETLGVTLAAQIGVAPVLVAVFGTVPLIALPANLVVVPLTGPLTVWGLVAGVVGGIAGPRWAFLLQLPTYAMLESVMLVARTAARMPVALDGPALVAVTVIGAGLRWPWRAACRVVAARR